MECLRDVSISLPRFPVCRFATGKHYKLPASCQYIGLVFSNRYLNLFYPPSPRVTGTYYKLPAI